MSRLADGDWSFSYDVVIPTHGRGPDMVGQTIASVLGQTLKPRRVILVVDGPEEHVTMSRRRWPAVEVIRLSPSTGVAAARQAGIDAATSEWVAFVDDDDLWATRKMEITAAFVREHPDCRAVRTTYWIFSSPGFADGAFAGQRVELAGGSVADLEHLAASAVRLNDMDYLRIRGASLERLLIRNAGVIGSSCIRLDVLRAIPAVPDGVQPGDDHVLFCLVATKAEWWLIEEPLLFYRVHPGQDTRAHSSDGAMRILQTRRLIWELCAEASPVPLSGFGRYYRREFRGLIWSVARRGRLIESFRLYREALPLLPRAADRLALFIPEPVAWRWHRLLSRQVKRGKSS